MEYWITGMRGLENKNLGENVQARTLIRPLTPFLKCLGILLFAGYVSDAQGFSFFAAALGLCLAEWVMQASPPGMNKRFLILDPDTLNATPLREALKQILDEVRHLQKPIQLRLAPLTYHLQFRPQLQLNLDGAVEIVGCRKKEIVEQPHVWIPDHPLPLQLTTEACSLLTFTPARGDRVRVALSTPYTLSKREWLLLGALLAPTALLGYYALFSALLAFLITFSVRPDAMHS